MNNDVTVLPLKTPITFGSETVTEFKIKKPRAKEMRILPAGKPSMDDLLNLLGKCAAQPTPVIDALEVEDMVAAVEVIGNFLPRSPQTGD
ncbi:phage tail assembly protein [Bradyrhizobium sp.]|uniref:phage tail assembly protein n=1 Tax=Bradyrhizobium sp. TaxID=376 RepID=UPI0039E44A6D